MPGEKLAAKRAIVYIDGFNFYYGAIKGTKYKWLDLQKFFRMLRVHDDIQAIRYFTTLVNGSSKAKQEAYLRALETTPLVKIALGKFVSRTRKCKVAKCHHSGSRAFGDWEEKRTDVNIGVCMLDDAYQDACDRFILVSGDSDLVPPIAMIKKRFPEKQVTVYVPATDLTRGAAVELRGCARKNKTLPLHHLKHCQFPATIPVGLGEDIRKPSTW